MTSSASPEPLNLDLNNCNNSPAFSSSSEENGKESLEQVFPHLHSRDPLPSPNYCFQHFDLQKVLLSAAQNLAQDQSFVLTLVSELLRQNLNNALLAAGLPSLEMISSLQSNLNSGNMLNYSAVFYDAPYAQAIAALDGKLLDGNELFFELTGLDKRNPNPSIFLLMDQDDVVSFLNCAELLVSKQMKLFTIKEKNVAGKAVNFSISVVFEQLTGNPLYFSCFSGLVKLT
jgi:hypothetical protein